MNKLLLILPLINYCNASCEALWRSNISSAYSSSSELSEPVNAITSLSYTLFGIIGLLLKNYSIFYYCLMFLFILSGLSSSLHHYYYSDADWAYASDIIAMNSLASFSVFYILCDNEYYKYKTNSKIFDYFMTFIYIILNFITILFYFVSLISYKVNNHHWRTFLKLMIGIIVASQFLICGCHLIYNSKVKYVILKSSLWGSILFSTGITMFYVDHSCPSWSWYNKFNCHSLWHVLVSWSLFNTINVTNISKYTYQGDEIKYKSLIKYFPWFLYTVTVNPCNHLTQVYTVDSYTNTYNTSNETKFFLKSHRRSKSEGN
jgi:hypothetical protein